MVYQLLLRLTSCLLNQHSSTPQGSTSVNLLKMTVMALNIGKIAANSAYDMFSFHNYLIVILVFPTSVFVEGICPIASFPDHCQLLP